MSDNTATEFTHAASLNVTPEPSHRFTEA